MRDNSLERPSYKLALIATRSDEPSQRASACRRRPSARSSRRGSQRGGQRGRADLSPRRAAFFCPHSRRRSLNSADALRPFFVATSSTLPTDAAAAAVVVVVAPLRELTACCGRLWRLCDFGCRFFNLRERRTSQSWRRSAASSQRRAHERADACERRHVVVHRQPRRRAATLAASLGLVVFSAYAAAAAAATAAAAAAAAAAAVVVFKAPRRHHRRRRRASRRPSGGRLANRQSGSNRWRRSCFALCTPTSRRSAVGLHIDDRPIAKSCRGFLSCFDTPSVMSLFCIFGLSGGDEPCEGLHSPLSSGRRKSARSSSTNRRHVVVVQLGQLSSHLAADENALAQPFAVVIWAKCNSKVGRERQISAAASTIAAAGQIRSPPLRPAASRDLRMAMVAASCRVRSVEQVESATNIHIVQVAFSPSPCVA